MHHFFHGISTTNAHVQLICGLTDYVELVTIVAVPPFFRFRERHKAAGVYGLLLLLR